MERFILFGPLISWCLLTGRGGERKGMVRLKFSPNEKL